MENILIEKTNHIPKIDLNAQTGVFLIEGKSYPENTFEVYEPIINWLETYFDETTNETTTINLELTYLNSSSLKAYYDMFDIFNTAKQNGKCIKIHWIYESDDDIIEEIGEDFIDDFEDLNIELTIVE